MEYIRKSIYTRPEIRRTLLPLWSAWALTAVGAVCGVIFVVNQNVSNGASSALLGVLVLDVDDSVPVDVVISFCSPEDDPLPMDMTAKIPKMRISPIALLHLFTAQSPC